MKRAAAKAAPTPTAPVLASAKPGDALLIVTPHTRYMDVVVEADAASVKAKVAGRLRRSDGTGIGSLDVRATPARKIDGQAIAAEQFLRRGKWWPDVDPEDVVKAARLVGWKD
jgi:hypothetical protein